MSLPDAEAYNKAIVAEGDRVEVELWDRPGETPHGESNGQPFPRGTMLYGVNEDPPAADLIGFETVDFLSVEEATTAMNMYETED